MPPQPKDTQVKRILLGNRSLKSAKFPIFRPILPTKSTHVFTVFLPYMRTCGSGGTKSASAIPMQNPFNLGVLGLGGHPSSKMSTFYNGVKKLFHHKLAQREKYFIDVLTDFTCLLPITVPDRKNRFSLIQTPNCTNPLGIRKNLSKGIGNAEKIDKKKVFGSYPAIG